MSLSDESYPLLVLDKQVLYSLRLFLDTPRFYSPNSLTASWPLLGTLILFCVLVDYSETGTVIFIQSTQDEICAFISGQNEAPIVQHSNMPS